MKVPQSPQIILESEKYLILKYFLLSQIGITEFDFDYQFERCEQFKLHLFGTLHCRASYEFVESFHHPTSYKISSVLYHWKYLFNTSNGSLIEFYFITGSRSYQQSCSKRSISTKIQISGIRAVCSFLIFIYISPMRLGYKELGLDLVEPFQDQPRKP